MTEEEYDLSKMTRLRSAEVEKARSCKHWGIILGTLGRQGNIKLLDRLQALLKQRNIEYDVVLLSEISNATVGLRRCVRRVVIADDTHRLLGAAGLHAAFDRLGNGIRQAVADVL